MSLLDDEKRFYERFWTLLRDAELMKIFEDHGPAAFRRSSVLEGFEAFVKSRGFGGRCCVEIGTLKGLTAIVLSRYFERVITIDIVDDPQKREFAETLGIGNVDFRNVRDNAEKAALVRTLTFDAAFVDGDHARDTGSDFALVRHCGQVLFHEHWDAQPDVVSLVERLRRQGRVDADGKWALWRATA